MSRHTWAASLLAALVAVLVGLALLLQPSRPTGATHDWEIALCTIGTALFLGIVVLCRGLVLERPRLIIDEPIIESVSIRAATGASVPAGSADPGALTPDIACLHIRNEPRRGSSTAEGVHISLEFEDADVGPDELALSPPIAARWSHTPKDAGPELTQRPIQENLLSKGVKHRFDVAIKYRGDADCYAMNDENRYQAPLTCDIDRLVKGRYSFG